ncbi:MAG: hypothetical protein BHW64_01005 [Candidatus Melainabacteria bacterium LEY3_CP_29_8]|nr:MAG: hypothetical protein BHW64_01005 [Candidatus Melainabacteria bacterium LEY3_CP_29_8]
MLNETLSGSLLFECEKRVKAAWVEFSTAMTSKWFALLVTFGTKSGFAYGWSEANPHGEQTKPNCPKGKRQGSVSLEQIQDSCSCTARRALNI